MNSIASSTLVSLILITAAATLAAAPAGITPAGRDGTPLNLDFEDGTLKDWKAEGKAFDRQPIKGDTVHQRRPDMKSEHTGDYWIGTFEIAGDDATGTLTSVPFKVTQPFASFLVGGGSTELTRVELVRADTQNVFFKVSGFDSENLRPVVIDLQPHLGKEIFIRVVDQQIGGWGHINFDDFKFYAAKPVFANAIDPATIAKLAEAPPVDVVKFAGLSPEAAAKEATVPPGFKLHLFAGEPDVKQPIAFALDDRGRVWVAEAYTYPRRAPEGQGKDRILVFEDTNGDHKFDKRTVFMEGLNLVSGLEVGFGGVWVGAAPYLMFIPVKDWDDPKPAGAPQILLDGWDFKADTHETLNTFTWGPDGWLYGCHGVFCPSFVGKPGTPLEQRQRVDAAVWRYHPTKQLFEVFAEGTSNPWGIDFDEYGQCIIEACVIPHLWHMIQGARYERQGGQHYNINADEQRDHERYHAAGTPKHVNPFIYDDIKTIGDHVHYAGNKGPHAANGRSDAAGGGHAHAGLMAYLGESWPEQYRNKVFMNNIHGQRINMDILERQGSGYVGHHGPDFVNFNDTWSQILNMRYDQNGSVYFIDWYDKNQCHHNNVEGHDRSNGRIFKLVYNNEKWTPVDLAKKSDEELLALVPSKNEWMSRTARRLLQERFQAIAPLIEQYSRTVLASSDSHAGDKADPKLLQALKRQIRWAEWANHFLEASADQRANLRVLWFSHLCEIALSKQAVANAGKDELFRAWQVQFALERGIPDDAEVNPARLNIPGQSGKNLWESMMVRLLAAALDNSPVVRLYAASALQRVPPRLRWDSLAALLSHNENADDHNLPLMTWYAMEPVVESNPERALAMSTDSKLPRILNFTTRRVAAIGTPEALAAITQTLSRAVDDKPRLDILSGLSVALKGQRSVTMPAGWESIESTLSTSANSEIRALTQSLSLTFGSGKALAALRKTVTDSAADPSARRTALDSLLGAKDAGLPPILQALLQEPALRGAALRGLAGYDDSNTPAPILAIYSSLSASEKREALNTLSSRPAYARPLLDAINSGTVSSKDLSADLVRQLRNLKNAELDQAIQKVWGAYRESSEDKKLEIEKYKRIYRAGGSTPGDASRGRAVFVKGCQQCHTLFGAGGKVGPDITGSNRGDTDYVLQNVLDPNAVIPNEYRAWNLETKDGRSITGIVKQHDDKAVTIASATESVVVPRNEIASLQQSELSMMPEGLLSNLSDQEVRDLIYYLSRPGQAPLIATPDTVSLFFNGKDLTGWDGDELLWKVDNGEIVGRATTGLKHNEFLKSQMMLGDFRLVLKMMLAPNKENSGIQFRSEPHGEFEMKGYQADAGAGWWGKLYEENGRAILWDQSGEAYVNQDGWNTYEVVAVGSKIRTAINGHLCVDLDDPPGARQGIIGLQMHAGGPMEVRFKDFKLELNPKPELLTVQKRN